MTSTTYAPHAEAPRPSVREIQQGLAQQLSVRGRVLFTLLLLFALAVATVVGSLWLTEPALPMRTRVAFAAITLAALAWTGVFAWTLGRRKVFLARHRLVTTRLAVLCTAVFAASALVLAVAVPELRRAGLFAGVLGVAQMGVAVVLWRRAAQRHHELVAQARELERRLR